MLWLVLTFLAALIWASVDLLSKFVIDKELGDPHLANGMVGVSLFGTLGLVSILLNDVTLSFGTSHWNHTVQKRF